MQWSLSLSENHTLKLLAVLAHPDDESFGPGGTLACYARQGIEVHLVCATRGEAGDIPPEMLGEGQVAQYRENELRCAAAVLGLTSVHFLDYRDSGMPGTQDNLHPDALMQAPVDEVAQKITNRIRIVRPQVVITPDPIGGYHHPDHIAIHHAGLKAFHAAGDTTLYPDMANPYQPQKLYYHTFSKARLRFLVRLLPLLGKDPHKWGRNKDVDLVELASHHFPVHARIDVRAVADIKRQARSCHASQLSGHSRTLNFLDNFFQHFITTEPFMRAYPPVTDNLFEKDLFAGVTADDSRLEPHCLHTEHG